MPRPRRYKAIHITSFYIPVEKIEVLEKARDLAKIERITFSELIVNALHEYVERHYPGNPQIRLEPSVNPLMEPKSIKAEFIYEDLKDLMNWNIRNGLWYRKMRRLIVALSELNKVLKKPSMMR